MKTFFGSHTEKSPYDLCGINFEGKSRTKFFLASLGKLGQKFFASPNICLLLHLCANALCCSFSKAVPDLFCQQSYWTMSRACMDASVPWSLSQTCSWIFCTHPSLILTCFFLLYINLRFSVMLVWIYLYIYENINGVALVLRVKTRTGKYRYLWNLKI